MTRSALALIFYVAWLLVAFIVRTIVHWRRTGSSGFKGLSPEAEVTEWLAGAMFVAALAAGFVGALLHVSTVQSLAPLESDIGLWVGIVLFIAGSAATTGAQAAMGASWRIGVDTSERTELVTGGSFQIVRNPIFSTMVVTAVGLFLIVPNLISFFGLALLVTALELQVRLVEEPYLLIQHGEEYKRYASKVGRFLPGVGRGAH